MSEYFYQTISLTGEKLELANATALKQAELILEIFKANPSKLISPSQMLYILQKRYEAKCPITSVRRAMSDLSADKFSKALTKTSVMVPGTYHLDEHTWMLTAGNSDKLKDITYEKGVKTSAADFANMIIATTNKLKYRDQQINFPE